MHGNDIARISCVTWVCVVGLVLGTASAVFATGMPVTANIIEVTATSGDYTATFSEVFPVSSFTGELVWSLPAPVALSSGTVSLGTIDQLKVSFQADPEVALDFSVTNTSMTDPILYDVMTATIVFDPVPNAVAEAAASLTLTPGAGSPGASVTGLFPGSKCYQARYSTNSLLNTKTVFANLDSSMSVSGVFGTDETEFAGPTNLNATVYMMEAEYKFNLSAGDQASGTSIYVITPEPATLALLGLGAVVGLRRRRLASVLRTATTASRSGLLTIAACGLAAVLFVGSPVFATGMPVSASIVEVSATSGEYTATFSEIFPVSSWTENLVWNLPSTLTLADGAVNLGSITKLNLTYNADPEIDLNFSLSNTNPSSPVYFNIKSATIFLDGGIPNAEAAATSSLTLTRGVGSTGVHSVTGQFAGGKCYEARYSTNSLVNTGTIFASLDPSMSTTGLGMSETETLPATGMSALNTTVWMMEAEYKFVLSPKDQASGTSAFLITPEPATLLVVALGALTAIRRRGQRT